MTVADLTKEERKAIAALKRVAKKWPKSLWLFAGGQFGLEIMKTDEHGQRAIHPTGGFDDGFSVGNVDIPADGGDW